MATKVGRLAAVALTKLKPGMHADGGGLYLQVTRTGGRMWSFRFMLQGRAREMGLGPLHTISLSEARQKATECRKLLLEGVDPIEARNARRAEQRLAAASAMTFKECADAYIGAHKAGWSNRKSEAQWSASLVRYAYPILAKLPVQVIDTGLVLKVIEPAWPTKTETMSRVRGRIESILDWATVRGYRQGENPARWRGHLENMLPKRQKVAPIKHYAALPYQEISTFVAELRRREGVATRALEFAILTAARTGEVLGAKWGEIHFTEKLWIVPAERMKARREHRVPLSDAALAVLGPIGKPDFFVFPGRAKAGMLSERAMKDSVLAPMGCGDLTVHGFRSTFRDWAAERTNFPHEVAEMALAHIVSDKVEAAYRRGDLFEKRRRLMDAWAKHCEPKRAAGNVVQLGAA